MFDSLGPRHKLIIFSEHRDTINCLVDKIRSLLGRAETVVTIHGGMGRLLLNATIDPFHCAFRDLLKKGALLVDPNAVSEDI